MIEPGRLPLSGFCTDFSHRDRRRRLPQQVLSGMCGFASGAEGSSGGVTDPERNLPSTAPCWHRDDEVGLSITCRSCFRPIKWCLACSD